MGGARGNPLTYGRNLNYGIERQSKPMMNLQTIESTKSKMIVNKAGDEIGMSHTYIDRKSYGARHGLKGAALEKGHKEYRTKFGVNVKAAVGVLLTQDTMVPQKWVPTKSGNLVVTFVPKERLETGGKKKAAVVVVVTEDEAMTALAKAKGISVEELELLLA